jgi:hypothetical protein
MAFLHFFKSLDGISGGISGPFFAICDRNISTWLAKAKPDSARGS